MAGMVTGKSAATAAEAAAPPAAERPLARPARIAVAEQRRFAAQQALVPALAAQPAESAESLGTPAVAPARQCVGELPACARPAEKMLDHSVSRPEMRLESIGMERFFAEATPEFAALPAE